MQATAVNCHSELTHQEDVRISRIFNSKRNPHALETNCVMHV